MWAGSFLAAHMFPPLLYSLANAGEPFPRDIEVSPVGFAAPFFKAVQDVAAGRGELPSSTHADYRPRFGHKRYFITDLCLGRRPHRLSAIWTADEVMVDGVPAIRADRSQ